MQTLYLKEIGSTQNYLKDLIKAKKINLPFAVVADAQTNGIGSRENIWNSLEGNLFLSFAIELKNLPKDLKLESASIYFAYLLKNTLKSLNSEVWLKWPNDFYIKDKKIGGMITNIVGNALICGVGLNLVTQPDGFSKLDIEITKEDLLKLYFTNIEKKISWKQVFSKYELEFHKNKNFFTHNNSLRIPLEDVTLQSDGSIVRNGERIYSLR
ncbi:biotin-[acetyl-CoA-carboxylase] ligase [Sulfurimonas gotlandica GD1]|uniref:Biotin-[acetyl-CoA-carboxylase] ligase n=1 Tax=Sulfurimonas gotlandica (strain DSM 19862 / JCM 16533 / GD1) TaxID=929558 RepID=B6BMU2_SULGG|nr:biotin--[acetyl-CoA-carboxylase] ligase [Sulfurimonas gotlandica]EDZ61502.1 biotin-(acetyl-CoA-carboxylase) ligase [Sulfurimonas gotlandica GD1]EHP30787.1 biotin-[acetyl-CoA-carboxylase] ligase [Sulfurimonas gotlandica GD1]